MDIRKKVFGFVAVAFLLLAILFGMFIMTIVFGSTSTLSPSIFAKESLEESILINVNSSTSLSVQPSSISASSSNDTWLNFDGINDELILPLNVSISIWFTNSTGSWNSLVNSSTQSFVNGISGQPESYPFYRNATNFIVGKSNSSDFFNGSIDEIRIYSRELNPGEPLGLYLIGRI